MEPQSSDSLDTTQVDTTQLVDPLQTDPTQPPVGTLQLTDIWGMTPTEDQAPTYAPARFEQQYRVVGNGGSSAVYIYDQSNHRWIGPLAATVLASANTGTITSVTNGTFTSPGGGSPVLTATAHGLIDGDTVELTTTGTLPTPLALTTKYYIRDSTTNAFRVSLTPFGTAINCSDSGTGTHTWTNKFGSMIVTFTPKKHLKVVVYAPSLSSSSTVGMSFNTVGGSTYGTVRTTDAGAAAAVNAFTQIEFAAAGAASTNPHKLDIDILNIATQKKTGTFLYHTAGAGAAGGSITTGGFVWNETSNQISQINVVCLDATRAGFGTGSIVTVYGYD